MVWRSKLKFFGCIAFVHIPKEKRTKFDKKCFECIMVGYTANGYRLWDKINNRIVTSRNVQFARKRFLNKMKKMMRHGVPMNLLLFWNGYLDHDIYMKQQEGYIVKGKEHIVYKVKKIYAD